MSFSSTTLVGNLGQKPETKILDSGSSVTRFSLATSRIWKNVAGEKQEETMWHNVVLWGKLGELAEQYLDKGSKVLIQGRLSYRKSEYEGQKRYYTDIVATEMKFLSSSKRADSRFPTEEPATPTPTKQPTAAAKPAGADDDLPF